MALLTRRGRTVQPFKCGPDYIDTKFHEAVCGRPSVNLDSFMAPADHLRHLYARYGASADVCIVEGMMGLYDGYERWRGSSAEIARLLGLPVVLVVDARSAAYSLTPLLRGFAGFDAEVHIAGVIFNRVGSARHRRMLAEVCADAGLRCYGCLPRDAALEQPSRYLGLDFSHSAEADRLVSLLEEHVDWQGMVDELQMEQLAPEPESQNPEEGRAEGVIAVARNAEAFSFIYEEHLDRLRSRGRVVFFDPEQDEPLPADTQLLYLPGGYPEKHLEALQRAVRARTSIREYALRDGRILAECGGMMYLCERIVSDEGSFEMCGALPYAVTARQTDRRLSLGYRRFTLDGRKWRGHEFHYTQFLDPQPPSAAQVFDARGEAVATPVIRHRNITASYTHLYWI